MPQLTLNEQFNQKLIKEKKGVNKKGRQVTTFLLSIFLTTLNKICLTSSTPERKFLVRDEPHSKLITFSYH
jgi:hypothetical protein